MRQWLRGLAATTLVGLGAVVAVGTGATAAHATGPDGTLDTTFNHGGFDNGVNALAVQPDGKILVGGDFAQFDPSGTPVTANRIARLNSDGTLDNSFDHGGFDSLVTPITVQSDGKILVGGFLTQFDPTGTPTNVNYIARLNNTNPGPGLPPTGSNPTTLLTLGVTAIATGLALAHRRRRTT